MSGQVDGQICIRTAYSGPWTEDDARRLVADPALEEMFRACEEVAARYSTTNVRVTVV